MTMSRRADQRPRDRPRHRTEGSLGLRCDQLVDARRVAYGNDLTDTRTLHAVTMATNQSKGAADPSNWLPPYGPFVCTYGDWDRDQSTLGIGDGSKRTRSHPQRPHVELSRGSRSRSGRPAQTQQTRLRRRRATRHTRPVCIPPAPPDLDCRRHSIPQVHRPSARPAPIRRQQRRHRLPELTPPPPERRTTLEIADDE